MFSHAHTLNAMSRACMCALCLKTLFRRLPFHLPDASSFHYSRFLLQPVLDSPSILLSLPLPIISLLPSLVGLHTIPAAHGVSISPPSEGLWKWSKKAQGLALHPQQLPQTFLSRAQLQRLCPIMRGLLSCGGGIYH